SLHLIQEIQGLCPNGCFIDPIEQSTKAPFRESAHSYTEAQKDIALLCHFIEQQNDFVFAVNSAGWAHQSPGDFSSGFPAVAQAENCRLRPCQPGTAQCGVA